MSKIAKDNLLFFSFDCDFFSDTKIKLLRSNYGSDGEVLYIYLLTQIYGDKGYYLEINDDYMDLIADELHIKRGKIEQIVQSCVKWSLFDDILFSSAGILTSHRIQEVYQLGIKGKARKRQNKCVTVNGEYWLLSPTETGAYIFVSENNNGWNYNNNGRNYNNKSANYSTKEKKRNEDILIEQKKSEIHSDIERLKRIETEVKKNIEHDLYIQDKSISEPFEAFTNLIIDTLASEKAYINIDREDKPIEQVKKVFWSLTADDIMYAIEAISQQKHNIKNMKSYMLTCLYNSHFAIGMYYKNKIKTDFRF